MNFISVAFQMYDLDSDDKISRDELLAVLHMMVGDNISEEQVRYGLGVGLGLGLSSRCMI